MSETQNKRPFLNRSTLISLIVVLIVIQVGVLIYLWTMLRPDAPQEEPTVVPTIQQVQSPTSSPTREATQPPTATSGSGSGTVEIPAVVEPVPMEATNYTRRALMFDEELAMEHIAYLASDELEGRQPGTPGGIAAGDYIADRFVEYGLQPAGSDGTYFQPFDVPYGRITELPLLSVTPPRGEVLTRTYAYRTDYRALTGGYIGAGEGEGQVVWLNQCRHDDYATLDVDIVGKIVLCNYAYDSYIYRQAIEHQVGGLLLLDREGHISTNRRPPHREISWVPQTIPTYLISETVALDLLVGTDYTLDDLSLRFIATPLSTTVKMAVAFEEQEAVEARNVLGVLPGSDPVYGDEVIVIGAHYDHLGREPDGEIMGGANDNASGVATMLEIARVWQELDYAPARSVLFAAWDGEEISLSGARHYVENPTFSLTRTVAMLNLDMVSAGDVLRIDGEGAVADQLLVSAEIYGVTTTHTFEGSSDYRAFYEVGIPAAMPIWWPDSVYHTPDDTLDVIDPHKLKVTGALSGHTLAALAEGHVELERTVEQLRASLVNRDKEAFLSVIDPDDPDLQASQAAWFDNVWSRDLVQAVIEPSQIRIGDDEANVNLTVAYRWSDATRAARSVSYDVRFARRDGRWRYAGLELDALAGDTVTIARFSDVPMVITGLLTTTQEAYVSIVTGLGLEPAAGTHFVYYPDVDTLQNIARPAAGQATPWLVSSERLAEIAWGQSITPALISLALNQMGLPPEEGSWLREGLSIHYDGSGGETYLPILTDADEAAITSLLDFPDLSELRITDARAPRAYAWSATEYLLGRYGLEGLRDLCGTWGRSQDLDRAMELTFGISREQFESDWHTQWIGALRADTEAIQATIDARIDAVVQGDPASYLETVNPDNPVLRTEESNWFADLTNHPIAGYGVAEAVVDWSPGGEEAIVRMVLNATPANERSNQITYDARFVRQGAGWFYDGVAWDELASEHFVLKYDADTHDESWAQHVLDISEEAYAQVTVDLSAIPPLPQEIKAYDDAAVFRTLILLSLGDWADGWTGPGEALKIQVGSEIDAAIQRVIAHQLAQQILFTQGLEVDWLRIGVADFEAGRVFPLGTHWIAGRYATVVQDGVRRHNEFPLYDMPAWEDVPVDQGELFYAQSWSLVFSIVEQYGMAGLEQFIAQAISSGDALDTAASLRAILGMDTDAFEQEWRARAYTAAVPEELVSLAQGFDAERALADIAVLSGPEYGGRRAGTPGADMAAAYIAEQFAALGLEPLGDLPTITGTVTPETTVMTATVAVTDTVVVTETLVPTDALAVDSPNNLQRGYLQQFSISHTHIISVPTLALLDSSGEALDEFTYYEDFLEITGEGSIEDELVWVRSGALQGLHFGGAVVLQRNVRGDASYAAQLQAHGAGGLIVANGHDSQYLQTESVQSASAADLQDTIPVFEVTEFAFNTLLEVMGTDERELMGFQSPALPLDFRVRQTIARLPFTMTQTSNVLGLLPGSDPDLADEVIVVGAHYDHIGQSPAGFYFPGANQNASGVAAMLEMVRVWQEVGYRPSRSVLFAAWGAEEKGGAGIAHYMTDPAIPLSRVIGVISLDSIAGGDGARLMFYGTKEHDLPLIHRIEAGTAELEGRAWRQGSTGEGWHEPFNQAGIPTTKLIWADAEDDFYSLEDTADAIDLERLANSGEILTLAVSWLAGR